MRFALVLLPGLFLGALLHAQNPPYSVCTKSETGPVPQNYAVCLSGKQLVAHIATRKPVQPPGLNEPHVHIGGTVVACLCFARTGEVTQVKIISGPAMMQGSVLESVKDWIFLPVEQGGRRYGGCGPLRIHVVLRDGIVRDTIEEPEHHE
jgi:hypothetical protein